MLMLTSVMLLFLGNRNAHSATLIYAPDIHLGGGWSASGSEEFWIYQPYYYYGVETWDLYRSYNDYTYTGPQFYQNLPFNINTMLLNRIYYVTVYFPMGYVPTTTDPQPSGMFRVESWTDNYGYLGVTLPTPPWIDSGGYIYIYPTSTYNERVYMAAYCFYFIDNGGSNPPTVKAYLAGTLWAHPDDAPGYWDAKLELGNQMGIGF